MKLAFNYYHPVLAAAGSIDRNQYTTEAMQRMKLAVTESVSNEVHWRVNMPVLVNLRNALNNLENQ